MAGEVADLIATQRDSLKREKRNRRLAMDALIDAWVENAELKARLAECEAAEAIRYKADMRAIKRWQRATGKRLVWPDHEDLVVWLLMHLPQTFEVRGEK